MSQKRKFAGLAMTLMLMLGGGGVFAAQNPEYDRITTEMAELRELELLEPLDIEMQTREELQAWVLESVEEYPEEELLTDQRVLTFLGLIEPGTDLGELESSLLGEQVAGYYDPETKAMVVVLTNDGEELSANDELTFAHEVVHALQDQHFDLMAVRGDLDAINDDEYLATTSLVEGDATVGQVLYMLEYPNLLVELEEELAEYESPALDAAPLYYSESLLFPYDQGAIFVMEIYENGGWGAVDAVFANPPTTTEQILHPEKYVEREGAMEVPTPDPVSTLGEGWEVLDDNVFGEFMIDVFLRNGGASDRAASDAAAGWGGDAYVVAGNDDETAMVWSSVWDTEEDAEEFFETLVETESSRLNADVEDQAPGVVRITGDGYVAEVRWSDVGVTYTLAESETTLDALLDGGATPVASPVASPAN